MKLYVNKDKTQWAGTQADAKKEFGMIKPYEVPVDKAGLIAFLNNIGNDISTVGATPLPVRNEIISQANPPKDTLVGRCSMVDLKELSTMMNVLINRTWNSMDRLEAKV
jgi:hypothetical protein|tara:strand:- start:358 stop:684 length:327 start_codon:yes stop_codon:yes gene_type:complete